MMAVYKDIIRGGDRRGGVVTTAPQDTVSTAAKTMREKRIGCLIVVGDDDLVVGVISERDIVSRVTAAMIDPSKTLVGDVMTSPVVTCTPMTPLDEVRKLMENMHIRHVGVLDGSKPVGMVSSREIITRQLADARDVRNLAIFSLARLAEMRDSETGSHLERVREYTCILSNQLRTRDGFGEVIDDHFVELIYATSPLHDIGKVSIPDSVLLKPGRLDEVEYEIMKTHAQAGAGTLELALKEFPDADFLCMARDIAGCHHERVDGKGYPRGLAGKDIPLSARVFGLVDVYDALVSKRVYKDAFTPVVAKNIIIEGAGTQFDEDVVTAFLECESEFTETYHRLSSLAMAVA